MDIESDESERWEDFFGKYNIYITIILFFFFFEKVNSFFFKKITNRIIVYMLSLE